ncbi:MAG: hypothetical protein Q8914_01015 [Bacteroidota bacterium]|nr:hypothetical protein [Bacteroidota bacterium]
MKQSGYNRISHWGLETNQQGELVIGGCNVVELGNLYGTPLHVVDVGRLKETAISFCEAIEMAYPGKTSVHFAVKCNPVPGIVRILKTAGVKAEIMSEYELLLALKVGYNGSELVVNGPYKTDSLLNACLENRIRLLNVDSLTELERINQLCCKLDKTTEVLFRINPDVVPAGMNSGSAAASRKGSPFGLDMKGGEVRQAFERIQKMERILFKGFHIHIGSGVQRTDNFSKAILKLKGVVNLAGTYGYRIEVLDVGGGLGVPDSREMTSLELLLYQAFDYLPSSPVHNNEVTFKRYADSVAAAVLELINGRDLPELVVEPGRCLVSSSQLLILKVHQVKERKGIRKWLIADAGIGTLTMPTFYELHEIVLCNDVNRKQSGRVTIAGPGCFAADVVYRNKAMPDVLPGEMIAVLDSGAYFTSWESSFGFPRPAIVSAMDGRHTLLRVRETVDQMVSLDVLHD